MHIQSLAENKYILGLVKSSISTAYNCEINAMFIRVVDLETTGLEPPAEVCEIAYVDVVLNAGDPSKPPATWAITEGQQTYVKTKVDICPESSAIHHIITEDVATAPVFELAFPRLLENPSQQKMILCAHNCKFERQWLTDEITGGLEWICTYKCASAGWPDAPNHQNQTLRYWLRPEGLVRSMANPSHRAHPDAYVTAFILRDLLKTWSIEQLIHCSGEPVLLRRCTFGKHNGMLWSEIDKGYLEWILTKDFEEDVVHTARHYLKSGANK